MLTVEIYMTTTYDGGLPEQYHLACQSMKSLFRESLLCHPKRPQNCHLS